jgi:uncharacterized protein with von Willebrand factor type A (vWA) domain
MEDTDPATVIKVWEQITKGDEFDILNNVSVVLLRKGDAHKMLFDAIFDTFMKEPEEWYALS